MTFVFTMMFPAFAQAPSAAADAALDDGSVSVSDAEPSAPEQAPLTESPIVPADSNAQEAAPASDFEETPAEQAAAAATAVEDTSAEPEALAMNNSATPLIDVENVAITSGQVYDLSAQAAASTVYGLTEGTVVVEFQSTSSEQYQSLFSVSNPTVGNLYRHFHIYITPSGVLGMELRNNDENFKYTMATASVLTHGATNKIAFKGDAATKKYTLFANGVKIMELSKADFKFFADITGLSNISLGGTIRETNVRYPFGGTITHASVYAGALSDESLISMTQPASTLLIDKSDISIVSGSSYDLTTEPQAAAVEALTQGTIVLSYTGNSTAGVQSLISIGNSTAGNQNRHFHLYITNTGTLGMELRNTDSIFKYTLNRPASLQGSYHGTAAANTVAFKADSTEKTYKLFANGELVATLPMDAFKFVSDITGVNNVSLGATLRAGAVAYPFGGTIHNVKIYSTALSDEELLTATAATAYGGEIFYAGDGTGSNYYRIPTLLTLQSGTVVSSIDARYGGTHDAKSNIDIAFSRSTDGGTTWTAPSLPLVFDDYAAQSIDWPRDDTGKNVQISGSAAFIDTVLLQDRTTGRLFLFADAFTSGKGFNNVVAGTGFKQIGDSKYLKLHWHLDGSGVYNYTIRENGIIYNDTTNTATNYSVDENYRLKENNVYLTQKQYQIRFSGTTLIEETNNVDVNMCVFYKDSLFTLLPTNYLVMKYSDDEGQTWSGMKVLGDFRDVTQRMVLFGPGVGTQIQNGTHAGRLLISAYNSVSGDYGYLYSDDHGENWSLINTSLGGSGTFAEAQIVELPDGTLQTYMRTNVGKIGYITSIDGGMTWNTTAYIPNVTVASYGTQLSVIRPSQAVNGQSVLLLSTPTASGGRRGGAILVGTVTDTGQTGYNKYSVSWNKSYAVDLPDYGFSYSCLTELPNHNVGILYEKYDSWSRGELHLKNIMRYETYTLSELTQ